MQCNNPIRQHHSDQVSAAAVHRPGREPCQPGSAKNGHGLGKCLYLENKKNKLMGLHHPWVRKKHDCLGPNLPEWKQTTHTPVINLKPNAPYQYTSRIKSRPAIYSANQENSQKVNQEVVKWVKTHNWHWLDCSVGYSVISINQCCRFNPWTGHIQESTNECINK